MIASALQVFRRLDGEHERNGIAVFAQAPLPGFVTIHQMRQEGEVAELRARSRIRSVGRRRARAAAGMEPTLCSTVVECSTEREDCGRAQVWN